MINAEKEVWNVSGKSTRFRAAGGEKISAQTSVADAGDHATINSGKVTANMFREQKSDM